MGIFSDLEEKHQKDGMFTEIDIGVSYPLGMPILDQLLGFYQDIKLPDGTIYRQTRVGVPAGTITMFVGPSSSGKTALAYQVGWNIIEPFGEDSTMTIFNSEEAGEPQRVLDVTGMTPQEYKNRVRMVNGMDNNTFEATLKYIVEYCKEKESDKERFTYDTGMYNIHGEKIRYYTPDVIILDSLMKFQPEKLYTEEELKKQQGLTINGRITIERNIWLGKLVGLAKKYNLNIIIINHLANAIQMQPGSSGAKQLTFIPTGKNIPGGDKVLYYTSSIAVLQPINSKDGIKTESENGYNGVPVKAAICKSRSGPGGYTATLEFIQEAGFDARMTLLHFARENGLIGGRNPSCYFLEEPDVKFDTRIMLKEIAANDGLIPALFKTCKPKLISMIREPADPDDPVRGSNTKKKTSQLLRDMF